MSTKSQFQKKTTESKTPNHASATNTKESTTMTTTKTTKPILTTAAPEAAATPVAAATPPSLAALQTPPAAFVAPEGNPYQGIFPRATELTTMPQAIADVTAFASYAATLGGTVPAQADLESAMTLAFQWSAVRNASAVWDRYCVNEEGMAWTHLRALIALVKPAFDWAIQTNPQLPTKYKGLAAFLAAQKAIAQKGAATRRANKKEVAKGNAPTHGAVGKRRTKAAAKAALAAAQQNEPAAAGQVGTATAPAASAPATSTTKS